MADPSWSEATRRRWFLGVLSASALSVVWLLWPFLDVLVFAAVVAVVAQPLHDALSRRLGGRRLVAAVVTASAFASLVLFPISVVFYRFVREGIGVARSGLEWMRSGGFEASWDNAQDSWSQRVPAVIRDLAPEDVDIAAALADPLRDMVTASLSTASGWLPGLLEGLALGVVDIVLFVFAVVTFLAEGPAIRDFVLRLSPLDARYEQRLLDVFQEFAGNIVMGTLIVATLQGAAATAGYMMVGLPRAGFFGIATGMAAFVPLVGTAIIAVPACIYIGITQSVGMGLGLAAYAVVVVGLIDNLLRPLLIRGSARIHPLLIFLAVFGGLRGFGLAGVLVGPVAVAFFLALARAHFEEQDALQPQDADA